MSSATETVLWTVGVSATLAVGIVAGTLFL
jgi:hypothetical protein